MEVKVQKYDPSVDASPHVETYEVPWKEHMTVLEVLTYIHENLEPIAFDYSCRGRVCGRCSMMLNGEPMMACYTPVADGQEVLIEPLRGYPVIRDMIVEKTKMHDRLAKIQTRIRAYPLEVAEIQTPMDPVAVAKIGTIEWCCRCLSCVAACPVVNDSKDPEKYIGPAGMVSTALRYYDPFDQGDRIVEAVQNGMYNCIMCGKCDEVCPADEIKHLEIYGDLRAEAQRRGLAPA